MCAWALLVFCIISFASKAQCFTNGYSKETCETLIPNQNKDEPNVTTTHSSSPFKTTVSGDEKYRRNRTLEIVISGPNLEGFQLQVRKMSTGRESKPSRVGEFVEWPKSEAQALQCDEGKNTAVTHRNLESKEKLKFKWRAPVDDEGELKIYDAYVVAMGEFWADICDIRLECADFPPYLGDCGKEEKKGCVRYSANTDDCDGNTCNYLLTYEIVDNSVEFILGTTSNESYSYVAVGFSETEGGKVDLTACIRENERVFARHYTLEAKGKMPTETTLNIENVETDLEGSNFWCEFKRPIKDAGDDSMDFDKDLYWIYTWGKMNSSSKKPILETNWHEFKYNVQNYLDKKEYSDSSTSIPVAGFILISLSTLILLTTPWMY